MAHSSLMQVRVDEVLKQETEQFFEDIGIDIPAPIEILKYIGTNNSGQYDYDEDDVCSFPVN